MKGETRFQTMLSRGALNTKLLANILRSSVSLIRTLTSSSTVACMAGRREGESPFTLSEETVDFKMIVSTYGMEMYRDAGGLGE